MVDLMSRKVSQDLNARQNEFSVTDWPGARPTLPPFHSRLWVPGSGTKRSGSLWTPLPGEYPKTENGGSYARAKEAPTASSVRESSTFFWFVSEVVVDMESY